jgi:UDP:flavonoid glycosyltransferase YjiC (YdhE family)
MRVLVTTFPGYGHFHPVAPLGLAFRRAGHDVRVATHPEFGRWVESCGLPVLPAGRPEHDTISKTAGLSPQERAVQQFTTVAVPPFANDVLEAAEQWRPELVVSEEGEHAGPLIASVLRVPSATHSWPAPARPVSERRAREQALITIWREFGQPGPVRSYGDVYLDCCPPPMQSDAIDSIDGAMTVRPTLFDGPPDAATIPWFADLDAPVVFVTLGTVAMFARPDTLRLLVDAVAAEAATVVVATGPNATSVVPTNAKVRCARYVPLSAVLPVTDLAVSHGGASTAVACVLAGVPHLIVPQGAPSQSRTAERVAALDIGATIDEGRFDAATVRAAVRALLNDGEIRDRIAAVRGTLDPLPGPDDVARHLVGSI